MKKFLQIMKVSGIAGKAAALLFATAMLVSLTACQAQAPEETAAATTPAATTSPVTAAAETKAAQLTDEEVIAKAVSSYYEPKKLYETAQVSVGLTDILEDSAAYHIIMKADNKTEEELNLEITAVAFNGVTAENSSGWTVPASGDAYLYMSFDKDSLAAAGVSGTPGVLKVGINLYNSSYDKVDEGVAECVLDGANSQPAKTPEGKTVYDENGIVISYLGLTGEEEGMERGMRFLVENNTEDLILLNGGAAMAPGEELSPSLYAYALPDTKAVAICTFYNKDYSAPIDPVTLPLVDILFSIEKNNGDGAFITEPVTVNIGEEKRFEISEDGKSVKLSQDSWSYTDSEWTVTSSNSDALAIGDLTVEEGVPGEGRETVTVTLNGKAEGDSDVSLKYHPKGESLEATEDYWPTVYCGREIRFHVNEDGTVEAGEVWLEVPNLTGEGDNSFWYYILRNDGSVAAKNDAAG